MGGPHRSTGTVDTASTSGDRCDERFVPSPVTTAAEPPSETPKGPKASRRRNRRVRESDDGQLVFRL
jgi:hypothetical protein